MGTDVKMQKKIRFSWLFLPLSILIFIAFALFVERSGISYPVSQKPSIYLEPLPALEANGGEDQYAANTDCLVLYDSKSSFNKGSLDTVTAAFDSMKVPYSTININQSSSRPLLNKK